MDLPQKLFKEYTERMNRYSDEKIVEILNSEVGKGGWGTTHSPKWSWERSWVTSIKQEKIFWNTAGSILWRW